jgi:DNA-binding SARP family transcriptional activator
VTPIAQVERPVPEPAETRGHTSLSLLNAFELRCDGEVVGLPVSAQRLLAFLALHERPLLRPYVAGTLWLEANDDRASASLRSSLWRLNRSGHHLVEATSLQLGLAGDVEVDLRNSMALAGRLIDGTATADDLHAAETSLDGEVLPDWYDDWLLFERERFRQLSLHALEALADRLVAAGSLGAALRAALAAVRGEPLRESAHRAVIRVHLAEGNRSEAIRQGELCRLLLREKLGVEPSEQLDQLLKI